MRSFIFAAIIATIAAPALAEVRICETTLTGPAGQHEIYIEMDGDRMAYGEAVWAPPRQNARANIEFPRLELNYGIQDVTTGERTSLRYITAIHAVRMTQVRGRTATISLAPYTQDGERREWAGFAMARDPENTRWRNSDTLGGGVSFTSPAAIEMALTAPQLETAVVTDLNEQLVSGVFLMIHRPALDAMFDHAFGQLRSALENPSRGCRRPRHDELLRSQR